MYQQDPEQEHVMIDLETLGTEGSPVILSIGAVKFTAAGVVDEFHALISPRSCQAVGMTIDSDTVLWWLTQAEAARLAIAMTGTVGQRVDFALNDFKIWFGEDKPVWGNGASSDNVWLTNAFAACKLDAPWGFWNDRCYRTIRTMFPHISAPPPKVRHDALEDARSQALHLLEMMPFLP